MSNQDKIKDAFFKIKKDIFNLQSQISEIKRILERRDNQTNKAQNQTDRQTIQTDKQPLEAPEPPNSPISIGNEGVQTDRQTIRQTDRHIQKFAQVEEKDPISRIEKVSEVLDSLDEIKKDLRAKFKKLTEQEMLVFTVLYQLTDEGFKVDYSLLSTKTKLSESSIRDYIQKLIKKGIPVDKIKENNKKITLTVSLNFKKLASLHTIIALREL